MRTISKDQIRNLPAEQQEVLAARELQRIRAREDLLERAQRGMSVGAGVWSGLTISLAGFSVPFPRLIPIAISVVVILVGYHAFRIYMRLDAIMELLESSRSEEEAESRVPAIK